MIIKDNMSAIKAMDELARLWTEMGEHMATYTYILLGMDLALAAPEWADSILSLLQHDRGLAVEQMRLMVQQYPVSVSL